MYNMSGGLSGKARREHRRSRASRMYTEQLIAEYEDVDEEPALALVPIRRRGEFLQNAPEYTGSNDPSDSGAGMQLDLPLIGTIDLGGGNAGDAVGTETISVTQPADEIGEGGTIVMSERDEIAAATNDDDGGVVDESSEESAVDDTEGSREGGQCPPYDARPVGPVRRRALGMKTMSRPPVGWATDKVVDAPTAPFSVRGFTYGCAMGGAAAAVALLVGQLLFG